jgi:hypothetical protein
MKENRLTIRLTDEQQKQVKDATGKSVTSVNISLAASGELAEAELAQVAGGAPEEEEQVQY